MKFEPLTHQRMAIDHLLNNDIAALFAGMGLGKTGSTLAAYGELLATGASKGALVIAPLRVSLFTWLDEVAKWDDFRWMKIVSLRTPEGMASWQRGDACIYTINYESLYIPRHISKTEVVDHGFLSKHIKGKRPEQLPVDTVIWDELSKAKDPKSKRIKEFRRYRSKFKRHWGLTGTPAPNSHLDLFAQIRLLDDGATFGKQSRNFKIQYFEPVDFFQRKWQVREGCKGLIEEKLKRIALTLRSEDWLDIPPTEVVDVDVQLPAAALASYKKLQKEMLIRLEDEKIVAVTKAVLTSKLLQLTGGAVYAESLKEIFNTEEGCKTVTHIHDAKIKALRKLFDDEGREPMIVAIKFKHERDRILAAFPEAVAFHSDHIPAWNRGEIKMLVAHPLSLSHGLNLQAGGSRVAWFTPTYAPEEYDQLNARVARTGQKDRTTIFRLLCPGTIDDAVVATLDAKGDNQAGLLQTLKNLQVLAKIT